MKAKKRQKEFMEMLNSCQGTIMKICLVYTDRQPSSIKDLYQNIVCSLWECYPRFRNSSKPNTWVYRIALNTAYLQHRSHRNAPRFIELDENMPECVSDTGDNEIVDRLYQLIDMLDNDEKRLAFLYLDRLSLRDIAKVLGTTDTIVKHRIHHLKLKLKKLNENEQQ